MAFKLQAGDAFPVTKVSRLGGGEITLGKPREEYDWQVIVVYRGKHCPLCDKYLRQLEEMKSEFEAEKLDLVVVSADPIGKAEAQIYERLGLSIPAGYDLSLEQMQELGLYISHPRSPKETDRPFSEPGLFVVNGEGKLHAVDISNNPFVRPELNALLSGLKWIHNPDNDYPIRGTYA